MADPVPGTYTPSGPYEGYAGYGTIDWRRRIALEMMKRQRAYPQNIGQGIASAGQSIGDVIVANKMADKEAEYDKYLSGQAGRAAGALPPVSPVSGVPASPIRPPAVASPANPYGFPDPGQPGYPRFSEASDEAPAPMPTGQPASAGEVPLPPPRPVYDRNRGLAEMEADPSLKPRMLALMRGESDNPRVQQAVAEEIFNQSAARGTPLARTMLDTGTDPRRGYFPPQSLSRGQASEDVLTPVLRGSNMAGEALGFAPTGNASGGVAERGIASGRYGNFGRIGDETFVTQRGPDNLARLEASRVSGQPLDITPQPLNAAVPYTDAPMGGRDAIAAAAMPPAPAPPPVRTAALGGGVVPGTTATAAAPPAVNPMIVRTDIAPLPVQVAETKPRAIPGPQDPSVSVPGGRIEQTPAAELFGRTRPKPPDPAPVSAQERQAVQEIMMRPNDPNTKAIWEPVAQAWSQQRALADKQNNEVFQKDLENWLKYQEFTRAEPAAAQKRQEEADAAAQKKRELEQFAGVPVGTRYATAEKQHEKVENLPGQLDALRAARDIVQNQPMFSGGLATQKRALASLFAGLNFTPDARLTPTEQFQALTRHLMGQVRGPVAGPGTASDRDTANMLASIAADPTLQKNTVLRVFDYLDHVAVARATQHQKQMLTLTGSDENTQRLFGQFQLPMTLVLPSSAIQQFNELRRTKGDAAASAIIDKEFHTPGLGGNLIETRRSVLE